MKKKFIEPQIKRIELNLSENIANSSPNLDQTGFYILTYDIASCTVVRSGIKMGEKGDWDAFWACHSSVYHPTDTSSVSLVPEAAVMSLMN